MSAISNPKMHVNLGAWYFPTFPQIKNNKYTLFPDESERENNSEDYSFLKKKKK